MGEGAVFGWRHGLLHDLEWGHYPSWRGLIQFVVPMDAGEGWAMVTTKRSQPRIESRKIVIPFQMLGKLVGYFGGPRQYQVAGSKIDDLVLVFK